MAAKLFWTNWRNPGNWTAGQRNPAVPPAMVSCSFRWANPEWQQKPIAGVTTLIGTAINIDYFNSQLSGTPDGVNHQIGEHVVAQGWDLWPLVTVGGGVVQTRVINFDEGPTGTQTFLINLLKPGAARWWAQKMFELGGSWCDGLHIDYWTGPSLWVQFMAGFTGIEGNETGAVDRAYMRALSRCMHHYRALRAESGKATIVIGQQFHNMNDTTDMRELDGRYVEQDPQRWMTFAAHQTEIDAFASVHGFTNPKREGMVFEFATRGGANNNKAPTSQSYRDSMMAFANANNCYVSWGRDDFAGFEWPG